MTRTTVAELGKQSGDPLAVESAERLSPGLDGAVFRFWPACEGWTETENDAAAKRELTEPWERQTRWFPRDRNTYIWTQCTKEPTRQGLERCIGRNPRYSEWQWSRTVRREILAARTRWFRLGARTDQRGIWGKLKFLPATAVPSGCPPCLSLSVLHLTWNFQCLIHRITPPNYTYLS